MNEKLNINSTRLPIKVGEMLKQNGNINSDFYRGLITSYDPVYASGSGIIQVDKFLNENTDSEISLKRSLATVLQTPFSDAKISLSPIIIPQEKKIYSHVLGLASDLRQKGLLDDQILKESKYPTCYSSEVLPIFENTREFATKSDISEKVRQCCFEAAEAETVLLLKGTSLSFRKTATKTLDNIRTIIALQETAKLRRQTRSEIRKNLLADQKTKITPEQIRVFLEQQIYSNTLTYLVEKAVVLTGRNQYRNSGILNIELLKSESQLALQEIVGKLDKTELFNNVWSNSSFFKVYSPNTQTDVVNSIPDTISTNTAAQRLLDTIQQTQGLTSIQDGKRRSVWGSIAGMENTIDDCFWLSKQVEIGSISETNANELVVLMRKLDLLSWPKPIDSRKKLREMFREKVTQGKPISCLSFDCFPIDIVNGSEIELTFDPNRLVIMKTLNPTSNEKTICETLADSQIVDSRTIFLPTDEIMMDPQQLEKLGGSTNFVQSARNLASYLSETAKPNFALRPDVISFADFFVNPELKNIYTYWFDIVLNSFNSKGESPLVDADTFKKDIDFRMNGRYPIPIDFEKANQISIFLTALYAGEIAMLNKLYGSDGFFWIQNEPDLFTFRLNLLAKNFPDKFNYFPLIYSIGKRPPPDGAR